MTENRKPPRELTPEEWRTLMITFVGGFASIIVGACVIGGAIALSRWVTHGLDSKTRLALIGLTVLVWGLAAFTVWDLHSKESKELDEDRGANVIAEILLILFSILLLLVWIGVAAGIK